MTKLGVALRRPSLRRAFRTPRDTSSDALIFVILTRRPGLGD